MQTSPRIVEAATRHQVLLERLKSGQYETLNAAISLMGVEMRQSILSLDVDKLSELSAVELQGVIDTLIRLETTLLAPAVATFTTELAPIAAAEAAWEYRMLSETVDATFRAPVANTPMLYAEKLPIPANGQFLNEFVPSWEAGERQRLENLTRKAFVDNTSTRDFARVILRDNIVDTKRRAEAVARTAIQHVSNAAREQVWIDNEAIVEGYRWISTLDLRTTTQCKSLDQRVFQLGKGPRPPLHFSCRSTTIPEIGDGFDFLDEGGTRASMGGSVGAKTTYYEWLKAQPEKFQVAAIGEKRAKLLRDGGLSAERFAELNIGRTFEPLTLAEMKKLEPLAFERAGVKV